MNFDIIIPVLWICIFSYTGAIEWLKYIKYKTWKKSFDTQLAFTLVKYRIGYIARLRE